MIYETMSGQSQVKLENETLRVVILPQMGGRVISLFHKGKFFEAAAQPGAGAGNAGTGMRDAEEQEVCVGTARKFSEMQGEGFASHAFGMDDAFPNIDQEDFVWKGRKWHYPDHGEIWRTDCRAWGRGREWVELTAISPVFGYCYTKGMSLEGSALKIHYRIVNQGAEELPVIWTWHGLMRYEEDMEILLPEGAERFRNVLDGSILGEEGAIYPLENEIYDFAGVPRAESREMVKYYVESRITEGHCGFYYPSADMSCILGYDAEKLPYLGVWITAGGFQGDYNCALEPTNGFYDSVSKAAANKRLPVLVPGETMEFELAVTLAEGKGRPCLKAL